MYFRQLCFDTYTNMFQRQYIPIECKTLLGISKDHILRVSVGNFHIDYSTHRRAKHDQTNTNILCLWCGFRSALTPVKFDQAFSGTTTSHVLVN